MDRSAGSDFQAEKASLGAVPIGVPKEASQVIFAGNLQVIFRVG